MSAKRRIAPTPVAPFQRARTIQGGELFLDGRWLTERDREDTRALFLKVPTLGPRAGYEVRASTIPSAGRGVFTRRAYRAKEVVTVYEGAIYENNPSQHDRIPAVWQSYCIEISDHYVIVGNAPLAGSGYAGFGAGALLNDARDPLRNNCEFVTIHSRWNETRTGVLGTFVPLESFIAVVTLRPIAAGEELFVQYSPNDTYWVQPHGDPSQDHEKARAMGPYFRGTYRDLRPPGGAPATHVDDSSSDATDESDDRMVLSAALRLALYPHRDASLNQLAWRRACHAAFGLTAAAYGHAEVGDWRRVYLACSLARGGRSGPTMTLEEAQTLLRSLDCSFF